VTTPFTAALRTLILADMRQGDRSQRTMADLIGVDHSMLSRWFSGDRVPSGESIDLIVAYLGRFALRAELGSSRLDAITMPDWHDRPSYVHGWNTAMAAIRAALQVRDV
jgi:transcriptional regulator with XRE-family HTH domain